MFENKPDCIADTGFISQICNWNPISWQDGLR